jgi:hypothetical protein
MSKEYKILDVQEDGLFFPNDDEVAYSAMKRVYKNNSLFLSELQKKDFLLLKMTYMEEIN